MSVNYYKSVKRMVERAAEMAEEKDAPGFNKAAYQLGYVESRFADFIHQVEFMLGPNKTKLLMEGLYMPVVHSNDDVEE